MFEMLSRLSFLSLHIQHPTSKSINKNKSLRFNVYKLILFFPLTISHNNSNSWHFAMQSFNYVSGCRIKSRYKQASVCLVCVEVAKEDSYVFNMI